MLPDYIAIDEVRSGALARILTDFAGPQTDINAVYLDRRHLPKRVAVLIVFLQKSLRDGVEPTLA